MDRQAEQCAVELNVVTEHGVENHIINSAVVIKVC